MDKFKFECTDGHHLDGDHVVVRLEGYGNSARDVSFYCPCGEKAYMTPVIHKCSKGCTTRVGGTFGEEYCDKCGYRVYAYPDEAQDKQARTIAFSSALYREASLNTPRDRFDENDPFAFNY